MNSNLVCLTGAGALHPRLPLLPGIEAVVPQAYCPVFYFGIEHSSSQVCLIISHLMFIVKGVRKRKEGVHPLPTWSTVSFCVHIHINLKPDLLVLSMEFRTASRVRRHDGTEGGDGVSGEIRETRVQSWLQPF